MGRNRLLTLVVLLVVIAVVLAIGLNSRSTSRQDTATATVAANTTGSATQPAPQGSVLGSQTKNAGCTAAGGLPDRACTPGAVLPSATKEQICVPGYAKNVRNVPEAEKLQVYREYGVSSHQPGEYEIDHLVSLELGGSNDVSNLWPEPAEPRPGFHEKDRYENYAHAQVCNGQISLQDAQRRVAENWLKYWTDAGRP